MPARKQTLGAAPAALTVSAFGELLEVLYGSLLDERPWQLYLDRLRQVFDAHDVALILHFPSREAGGAVVFSADAYRAEAEQAWNTHFFALDPFEGLPPERVCSISDVVSADRWRRSDFYREYLRPLGIEHILAVAVAHADGAECRLRFTRGADSGDFSAADKELLRAMVPHLKIALGLQARLSNLESAQRLLAGTVDRLAVGSLLLDRKGEVIFANDMANRLLDGSRGLGIVRKRLVASRPRDNAAVQARIQKALQATASAQPRLVEAMSIAGSMRESRLSVLIRAVSGGDRGRAGKMPAVAVFVRDTQATAGASAELIRQLHGLTRTETAVALLLADGLSADEAAQALGIRPGTVRVHLRSIFTKTGVDRQSALIRLLLSGVATLA